MHEGIFGISSPTRDIEPMTDDRLFELINLEIDEQISDAELEELNRLVAGNQDAAGIREEMRSVARELDAIDSIDPPGDFQQDVLARIRERRPTPKGEVVRETPFTGNRGRVFRYAWALAAGLLLGLLLSPLFIDQSPPSVTSSDASGTMREPISSDDWEVLTSRTIHTPPAVGRVEARRARDRVAIDLELRSEVPTEVELRFDPADLGLAGFSRSGDFDRPLRLDQGAVIIPAGMRTNAILFLADLQPGASSIEIIIRPKDTQPITETIRIEGGHSSAKPTF